MPAATSFAFDLKESDLKGRWTSWQDLANWIANELDLALSARSQRHEEVAYSWAYYEQQRMRSANRPWPDAADLPSPMAPEYTDAIHARLMQTIFVKPMYIVEGWGASAAKARLVEEFHQRALEDERLQGFVDDWVLRGLIEGVGTLMVHEQADWRRHRVSKRLALQLDETGAPVMGPQGPMLAYDEQQAPVEVKDGDTQTPAADTEVDEWRPEHNGPQYDVLPYRDFLLLPAHARHRREVWGYSSRFFRRMPQLEAWGTRGWYAKDVVAKLTTADERQTPNQELPNQNVTLVDQQRNTAQKELYECQLLLDLDGEGERWWVLTVHRDQRLLLRCKVDDGSTSYIRWRPFPKPGTLDHGYSLVGHKLISVIEEDTARRNMKADRMALKAGAPLMRRVGALWDPLSDPIGPRAVIDVRDFDEVRPLQGIEDVPNSLMAWGPELRADADRLIGQNDTAIGVESEESRTLGEVQLRAGYAEVRVNVIVKRMQESLEQLAQVRHGIWLRYLRSQPQPRPQRALMLSPELQYGMNGDWPKDGQVTAEMLSGLFWFIPRGSVETADLNRQKADLNGLLAVLGPLMQINPAFRMILSTLPAAKAIMEQVLRVYRWPDRQSFLGSEAHGVFEQIQEQQEQQAMEARMLADPRMRVLMALAGGGGQPMMGGGQPGMPMPASEPGSPPTGAMPETIAS